MARGLVLLALTLGLAALVGLGLAAVYLMFPASAVLLIFAGVLLATMLPALVRKGYERWRWRAWYGR